MTSKKPDAPAVDIWMPVYIGDFMKYTNHLSPEEVGVLHRLQMHYWANGGPFPDDDKRLSRITGQSLEEWRECKGEMADFFHVKDGLWISEELNERLKTAIKNRKTNKERSAKAAAASVAVRNQRKLQAELEAQQEAQLKDVLKLSPSTSTSPSPLSAKSSANLKSLYQGKNSLWG